MMWWIILAALHIVVVLALYYVASLPNRGTGGLSDMVLPFIFTAIVMIIDIVVIIYQAYKHISA